MTLDNRPSVKPEPKPKPMAMCTGCGAPLIMTFAFSGYEFYCLECDTHLGFLSPRAAEPTPELQARYEALRAEWDEHAGAKLLPHHKFWRDDCERCRGRAEDHWQHVTDEERAANLAAREWLKQRARRDESPMGGATG